MNSGTVDASVVIREAVSKRASTSLPGSPLAADDE